MFFYYTILISPKQISRIHRLLYIPEHVFTKPVRADHIGLGLKPLQIIHHCGSEELHTALQCRLIDDDRNTLLHDALHDALEADAR